MKCKHNSVEKSKLRRIYDLFLENPQKVFIAADLHGLFNSCYVDKLSADGVSSILKDLWKKGEIIRTKTQLSNGYLYSLKNKNKLEQSYYKYLLPYDFADKELINLIELNKFEKLDNSVTLDTNKLYASEFLAKYDKGSLIENKIEIFLTKIITFIMGDGHITKDKQNIYFYFKHLEDAQEFVNEFMLIFNQEKIKINKTAFCYEAVISSKAFGELLEKLGAPIGNKVLQPFLVPEWIYYGSDEIKIIFLSVIYGNEGSKPQDNKWRIQFVISKNKENIKNLLIFLNQIRAMLDYFGISTSFIQLRKQERRHFCGRYYIKGKENIRKFYKLLEFSYASEKQKVLEYLILKEFPFEVQHAMMM